MIDVLSLVWYPNVSNFLTKRRTCQTADSQNRKQRKEEGKNLLNTDFQRWHFGSSDKSPDLTIILHHTRLNYCDIQPEIEDVWFIFIEISLWRRSGKFV